jgi:hypothetical protein
MKEQKHSHDIKHVIYVLTELSKSLTLFCNKQMTPLRPQDEMNIIKTVLILRGHKENTCNGLRSF